MENWLFLCKGENDIDLIAATLRHRGDVGLVCVEIKCASHKATIYQIVVVCIHENNLVVGGRVGTDLSVGSGESGTNLEPYGFVIHMVYLLRDVFFILLVNIQRKASHLRPKVNTAH
jgi:hypothetical protein